MFFHGKLQKYFLSVVLAGVCMLFVSSQNMMAMSGSGTEDDPYIIMTAEDLDNMRKKADQHYKLGAHIDLSGVEWTPIDLFSGALDGDGYVIKGLKVNQPGQRFAGFIGQSRGASFKNIGLEDVDLVGGDLYLGALVALFTDSTIETSYATGKAVGEQVVGGLVGRNVRGSIEDSYARVDISGSNQLGGLAGSLQGGAVVNSYAAGSVTKMEGTSTLIGGLIGHIQSTAGGTAVDSYWDVEKSGQEQVFDYEIGLSTKEMYSKQSYDLWDFDHVWQIEEGKSYPTLMVFASKAVPSSEAFSDIANHEFKQSIIEAVNKNIVTGYPDGTFQPEATVTRAQFAVMIDRAFQLKSAENTKTFTDQASIPDWAGQEIGRAVSNNIISGYEDGTFRPDHTVTHTEMVMMVARALDLQAQTGATTFADDVDIPEWAKGMIAAAQQKGLIVFAQRNTFAPNAEGKRGEAAALLVKALDL